MTIIERHIETGYSASQMFDLVNDIEKYPLFLSGCFQASIEQAGNDWMQAHLILHQLGVQHTLVTKNYFKVGEWITMELIKGPLKYLLGSWRFEVTAGQRCRVTFQLEFQFLSSLMDRMLTRIIKERVIVMMNSFINRAELVYGRLDD